MRVQALQIVARPTCVQASILQLVIKQSVKHLPIRILATPFLLLMGLMGQGCCVFAPLYPPLDGEYCGYVTPVNLPFNSNKPVLAYGFRMAEGQKVPVPLDFISFTYVLVDQQGRLLDLSGISPNQIIRIRGSTWSTPDEAIDRKWLTFKVKKLNDHQPLVLLER
jgi:hypothetical protein